MSWNYDKADVREALADGVEIEELFSRGVSDYWAGIVPDGWDDDDANSNPYFAGWNMAAAQDNQIGFFDEDDDEDDD